MVKSNKFIVRNKKEIALCDIQHVLIKPDKKISAGSADIFI